MNNLSRLGFVAFSILILWLFPKWGIFIVMGIGFIGVLSGLRKKDNSQTKKYLGGIAATVALTFLFNFFFPVWWIFVPIVFIIGAVMNLDSASSFTCGSLAMTGLWGIYASVINLMNGNILVDRMATVFNLPSSDYPLYITIFMGALLGGLAMMSGALLTGAIFPPKKKRLYKRY